MPINWVWNEPGYCYDNGYAPNNARVNRLVREMRNDRDPPNKPAKKEEKKPAKKVEKKPATKVEKKPAKKVENKEKKVRRPKVNN